MNITQINTAILQGGWSNDQLTSMIDAVKFARARLTEQTKRTLRIGDNVNFNSTKLGRNVTGVVVKIAIKFVTVKQYQACGECRPICLQWLPTNKNLRK